MINRISKLREKIINLNLDALFISNQYNVTYLTGFSGLSNGEREGFFLLTRENAFLLTFPTYYGLYKQGGENFITLSITSQNKLTDYLNKAVSDESLKIIGVEKDNLTLTEFESLQNNINAHFRPTQNIVEELRIIKDKKEMQSIRLASEVTDLGFDFIKGKIKKGITEKQLALELEFFLKTKGNDIAFPPIVAFNQNAAIPHYLSDNRQKLINNSLILFDFGAKVHGYCSDMTRVVFFGNPKKEWVKIYNTVLTAQKKALSTLKEGLKTNDADKTAKEYIVSEGFPEYPHGLGHGVGLAIHEAPRLKKDSNEVLKENMVITIEPGIYLEGSCGVRIEDLVVLRRNGCEVLSKSSKEITIIN